MILSYEDVFLTPDVLGSSEEKHYYCMKRLKIDSANCSTHVKSRSQPVDLAKNAYNNFKVHLDYVYIIASRNILLN